MVTRVRSYNCPIQYIFGYDLDYIFVTDIEYTTRSFVCPIDTECGLTLSLPQWLAQLRLKYL
jgi:hypothetical protein